VASGAETRLTSAWERAALVVDEGSIEVWDEDIVSDNPLGFSDVRPYPERLAAARERTGLGEAVLTGRATLDGRPFVLIAAEFGFLGGSIGVATGERVARAFERALEHELPVVALTASGGSRMQEGTLALVQMVKLAAAARRHRDVGLPYVVCFTHPTTGGVLASWGSLGTVTFALPKALVGFAGPRVVELVTGDAMPAGVQRAETLLAHGLVDAIVVPGELREQVRRVLAVAAPLGDDVPAAAGDPPRLPPLTAPKRRDAWISLAHARDASRPGADTVLVSLADDVTELRGDRAGWPDDSACLAALARVGHRPARPAVVVAQRREPDGTPRSMGPTGYRKARRAMALAAELRLPLVTIVDTPGARLSADAERGGLAAAMADCLATMVSLPVPTLALLLGEGGSGGALAFLAADRVLVAEHASLGVIAPEGASAILHHDIDHAPMLAELQGGASWRLADAGIADLVIPEPKPAHEEPDAFLDRLAALVGYELATLCARDPAERLAARRERWRAIGIAPV
jgi:acyl-CoA carboxylase subunit beta